MSYQPYEVGAVIPILQLKRHKAYCYIPGSTEVPRGTEIWTPV